MKIQKEALLQRMIIGYDRQRTQSLFFCFGEYMQYLKAFLLVFIVCFSFVIYGTSIVAASNETKPQKPVETRSKIMFLYIPKMLDETSEKIIRAALDKLSGIESIHSSIKEKSLEIKFDTKLITYKEIQTAIEQAGFEAKIKNIK